MIITNVDILLKLMVVLCLWHLLLECLVQGRDPSFVGLLQVSSFSPKRVFKFPASSVASKQKVSQVSSFDSLLYMGQLSTG